MAISAIWKAILRPWLMTLAPILISFSFRLDSDQSLIGSGVASVRRGATIVVLLLHENDAPLSLIDENKLCKDELGGAARVPVGVHCARLDEERITGFERDRLLSFILHNHCPFQNVKNHLASVVMLPNPCSGLIHDARRNRDFPGSSRHCCSREHLRCDPPEHRERVVAAQAQERFAR